MSSQSLLRDKTWWKHLGEVKLPQETPLGHRVGLSPPGLRRQSCVSIFLL